METISKAQATLTKENEAVDQLNHALDNSAEEARFGIIPLLITIVACAGGFAAAFGAHYEPIRLSMVVFPTMAVLTLILAVAPMRAILYASVIAVIMDVLVLAF